MRAKEYINKITLFIKTKLNFKNNETIKSTDDDSKRKKTIEEQQKINEMFPKKKSGKFGLFIGSVLGFIFAAFIVYCCFLLIRHLFNLLF